MGGSGPPSNTWFPGLTQVLNPNGSSIGAAVFAGLTSVTDRQTDQQTTLLGRQEQAASTYVVLRCGLIIARCCDVVIFDFLKRRPSAILDLKRV